MEKTDKDRALIVRLVLGGILVGMTLIMSWVSGEPPETFLGIPVLLILMASAASADDR